MDEHRRRELEEEERERLRIRRELEAEEQARKSDYSPFLKVAGAIGAVSNPLISAIASKVLLDRETSPARRRTLQTWFTLSLVVVAAGVLLTALIVVLASGVGTSSSGNSEFNAPARTVTLKDGSTCVEPANVPPDTCGPLRRK